MSDVRDGIANISKTTTSYLYACLQGPLNIVLICFLVRWSAGGGGWSFKIIGIYARERDIHKLTTGFAAEISRDSRPTSCEQSGPPHIS